MITMEKSLKKNAVGFFGLLAAGLFLNLPPYGVSVAGQKQIDPGRVLEQSWQAYNRGDLFAAKAGFEKAAILPKADEAQQGLLGLGYVWLKLGERENALVTFRKLVNANYRLDETLPVLLTLLQDKGMFDDAVTYAQKLPNEVRQSRLNAIDKQKQQYLYERLDPDSDGYRSAAEHLLKLHSDSDDVRMGLAWSLYRAGMYREAHEHFAWLTRKNPANRDCLVGAALSLMQLKDAAGALFLLSTWNGADDHDIRRIRRDAHLQLATESYHRGELESASRHLQAARDIDPQNRDALTLYAWIIFQEGRYDEARGLFEQEFHRSRSPEAATAVLLSYNRSGTDRQRAAFLEELAGDENLALREVSAQWYFRNGLPILAAQIGSDKQGCYQGYNAPWVTFSPEYQSKRGDDGLSRLDRLSLPIELTRPLNSGRAWGIEMTPMFLDAGDSPASPYAGSYFNRENVDEGSLINSRGVLQPSFFYIQEGTLSWSMKVGATPIGGPISPLPTFAARIFSPNTWHVELHQRSVQESILSTVGLEDPYSDKKWGRVVKSGFSAGKTFLLSNPWWLSLEGGLDYYWGENMIRNRGWNESLSLGRTDPLYVGQISWGLFVSALQFQENSDFFTFGHGGYFSPQNFLITGPFARYRTTECGSSRLDLSGSVGYMSYSSKSSRKYSELNAPDFWSSPAAEEEFFSNHPSQDENGIGGTLKIEGEKLLTPHLSTGGYAAFSSSSGYDEWSVGLTLRWSYGARISLRH